MLFFAVTPWWIGKTIDTLTTRGTTVTDIAHQCAVLMAFAVGGAVAILAEERTSMLLRIECELSLMRVLSRRSADVGITPSTSSAVNLGMVDITSVATGVSSLPRSIGGVFTVLLIGALMLATSWQLGLVILVGAVVALVSNDLVLRNFRHRQKIQRTCSDELTDIAHDIGGGARVIKGLGAAQTFLHRYTDSSAKLQRSGISLSRADSQASAFRALVSGIHKIVTIAFGAKLVLSGTITVGDVVTAYGYTTFLGNPLDFIMRGRQLRAAGIVSQQRIDTWLAATPASRPAVHLPNTDAAMKALESVVGASIPLGAYTGITSLDGRDWHATNVQLARATLGQHATVQIVGTDDYLFSGTLREVLTPLCRQPGDDGGSEVDARQRASVTAAMASDIVQALPDGLDTEMTAGAVEFSGGERQRLRLARALSTAPEVLVLVDPTAALDVSTESAVVSGIRELRADRTTVVLTYSLPHLLHADRVVVLGGAGEVVAVGTHHELEQLPEYRQLIRRLRGEA